MSDRQKTCEERIEGEMEKRLKDFRSLVKVIQANNLSEIELEDVSTALNARIENLSWVEEGNPDEDDGESEWEPIIRSGVNYADQMYTLEELREEARERIQEYPSGISVQHVVRIELSGGGPSDYIKLEVDSDGEVTHGAYHFLDWFDGARRVLEGSDLEVVANVAEILMPLDDLESYAR